MDEWERFTGEVSYYGEAMAFDCPCGDTVSLYAEDRDERRCDTCDRRYRVDLRGIIYTFGEGNGRVVSRPGLRYSSLYFIKHRDLGDEYVPVDNPLRDTTDSCQIEIERARLAAYPYLVADCEPCETDDDQPGEQQTDTNDVDSDTTERKEMADNSISRTTVREYQHRARVARQGAAIRQWRRSR